MDYPFHWINGATVSLAATTSSGNVALAKQPTGRFQLRIHNAGPSLVHVTKGADSTLTAVAADMPIPAGSTEVFTIHNPAASPLAYVAGITDAGTATIYFTVGTGD